ncbi:hypothetical protein CHAN_10375 [Corynebacterium hansenii]|nr:hypothetical protein CHAN_10375 [Corynebacterium hansenii]
MAAAPCRTSPEAWDSQHEGEDHRVVARRHRTAILRCRRCPALDACTRYLQDKEADGEPLDGIVAGRRWRRLRVTTPEVPSCRDCGIAMTLSHAPLHERLADDGTLLARHAGRGLCQSCSARHKRAGTIGQFPTLRRRKRDAS